MMRKKKNYLWLMVFALGACAVAHAQTDTPSASIRIKAIDTVPRSNTKASFQFQNALSLTRKTVNYSINYSKLPDAFRKTSGVDMAAKSTLKNKEWVIKQRFSEDQKDLSRFNRDYFLGELKTDSPVIVIKCRDHEYIDGDRIKLMLNNAVVHPNILLRGDYFVIDVDLVEGNNSISFIALNEGSASPNTAELKVLDSSGKVLASKRWMIRTGNKANLVVFKQSQ